MCEPDIPCEGAWSGCSSECTRSWTTATPRRGHGDECPSEPACALDEDECDFPRPCVGHWKPAACQSNCGSRSYYITQHADTGGQECPYLLSRWLAPTAAHHKQSCSPGEGLCPPDINCTGAWSDCSNQCTRTWSTTRPRRGIVRSDGTPRSNWRGTRTEPQELVEEIGRPQDTADGRPPGSGEGRTSGGS